MRTGVKLFIAILLTLVLCFAAVTVSIADAGGFSGDTDFGGSDWGSSDWGSSDWGSSDWGSSDWGSSTSGGTYWLDDDSSESFGGNVSSGSSLGGLGLFGCLSGSSFWVVIIIIAVIVYLRMKRSAAANTAQQMYTASFEGEGLPLSELKQKDPNFNEQAILEKVANRYVEMQSAWEKKQWEGMRAFMTDALYNQMDKQLNDLREKKLTNHVERIAVLETKIQRYMTEADNDVLVVRLQTRIVDYYTSDVTGQVVRGDQNRELFMTYDWKLVRNKDRKTLENETMTSISCPHCGAPLSINQSGKCEYCGSVITLSDHDWALSAIKAISQRSAR